MKFASHLGKKLLLPWLLNSMLYKLYMQDPQKNDCYSYQKKVRQSSRVPTLLKSLPDILNDAEKCGKQTTNIGKTVFQISCFMENSTGYYEPIG